MKNSFVAKSDLAMAYFPYICSHAATNKLMNLIHEDQELLTQLVATGYRKLARMLSPRQVQLIMERLGNPF